MVNLTEGMRPGDLEDLVLPMVSVDEYESKIDDDAIVIGFYVGDKDAAEDLNRFIQKSPVQLIDSEVSPAPDQHGYYLVFVEFINDRRIVTNIDGLLEEISPLAGIESWQMRLRQNDGVVPFSKKVLSKRFAEMRGDVDGKENSKEKSIMDALYYSDLEDALVEDHQLVLTSHNFKLNAEIAGFGEANSLLDVHGLTETALTLNMNFIAESMKIAKTMGHGWVFGRYGDHAVLQNPNINVAILLRNATLT